MADVLDFRPGVVSGGKLTEEDVTARQHACSQAALASLEASPEFKAWQRTKKLEAAREAAAGLPLWVYLLIALVAVAGGAGVWRATRPAASAAPSLAGVGGNKLAAAALPEEAEWWNMDEDVPAQAELAEDAVLGADGFAELAEVEAELPDEASWDSVSEGEAALTSALSAAHEEARRVASERDAAEEARAALQATLSDAHEGARTAGAAADAARADADAQRAAAAEAAVQLQAVQAALEAARQSTEDSSQLRQQVVRLQLELEEALAARQQAEAAASSAAEAAAEAAAQKLSGAQAAAQAAQEQAAAAAVAAEEREAAHREDLAAAQATRAAAEATAASAAEALGAAQQAAAAAQAERETAIWQAATARQEATAVDARASAADAELASALAGKRKAEESAASAAKREAALQQELEAAVQAHQRLAEQNEEMASEAGLGVCSAEHVWRQVVAHQRPELVGAAAAAAACVLLGAAALAAAVARRRRSEGAAPTIVSKELTRLQRQLEQAQQESESRVAAFKKAQAAADEATAQLEESRQWEAAAVQLVAGTAEVPLSSRAPLSARCSNLAAAAPLVLPAGKADSPSAWLDLLQQRWAALSGAAGRAGAAAEEAVKEQAWGHEKVTEMLTENELLKERLSDAKQAFADASAGEAAAKASATGLKSELDSARQALVAAEAGAADARARVDADLAAVLQERDELAAEAAELRRQVEEHEGELSVLRDDVPELERENSNLEAQMDQVTQALMEVQAQKSQLERRVAELEQDVASLGILAEKLERDKAVLEAQLAEAREAQAELCLASQQYIAADSAIKSIQASEDTERGVVAQDDLRRAVEEKVLALDLLASAERKLVEQQEESDASSPMPAHQLLLSGRRLSGLAASSGHSTPRSRSARVASFLGSKLGRVARLLSGDGEGSDAADTPTSAFSAAGGFGVSGDAPGSMGEWVSRTQALFSSAEHLLGEELSGQGLASPHGTPPRGARAPSALTLLLPDSARQREQQAALEAALQHSSNEVQDLLSALELAADGVIAAAGDAYAAGGEVDAPALVAAEAAVVAARGALAGAHARVQAAAEGMREAAQQAEQLKRQHVDMREQVGEQEHAVDTAQAQLESALEEKGAAERALLGAEGQAAAAAPAERATALAARQAALVRKQGAIEAAQSAAAALEAAEEDLDGVVDDMCQLEDRIRAALRTRASAHDELLREQTTLADVVQDAATALEQHAEEADAAAAAAADAEVAAWAVAPTPAGPRPQSAGLVTPEAGPSAAAGGGSEGSSSRSSTGAADVASAGSARSVHSMQGVGLGLDLPASGPNTAVRGLRAAEAEAAAVSELLEDAWFRPTSSASGGGGAADGSCGEAELDRGERAASSKDEAEDSDGVEEATEEVQWP